MNRVASLEHDNRLPSALLESPPCLGRYVVIVFESRQRRGTNQTDRAAYQEISSLIEVLDARMARLFGAVDQAGLRSLIIGENLLHRKQTKQFSVRAQQGRLASLLEPSHIILRRRQGDRQRPQYAAL